MNFHEVSFPLAIAFHSTGGPVRKTEIVTLGSGYEERNAVWAGSRRSFDVGSGVRTLDDLYSVIAFFEARAGQLYGFRFRDFSDFRSGSPGAAVTPLDQAIGTGDGATAVFPLSKTYASGAGRWTRAIPKPVDGTVRLALAGGEIAGGFSCDPATGLVTFAAPPGAGDVQSSLGLAVDNLALAGALSSATLNEADLAAGLYDNAAIASAATTDIGAPGALAVAITGTTTITGFGGGANLLRLMRFSDALTLTHNAISLALLGGASRAVAAGDKGFYRSDASGNWSELAFFRAAGDPGDAATRSGAETLTNKTIDGAANTLCNIANNALVNSSLTIAGHAVSLGGNQALAAADLSNGATGSGAVVLASGPSLVTPTLGVAGGSSLALGGAAIGGDCLGVTGSASVSGNVNAGSLTLTGTAAPNLGLYQSGGNTINFTSGGVTEFSMGTSFLVGNANGPRLQNAAASATNPPINPNRSSTTTGIGAQAAGNISLIAAGSEMMRIAGSAITLNATTSPGTDNSYNLGSASFRYGTVFAGSGAISTSDADAKINARALTDAEIAVARALAGNVRVFQFCDAAAAKTAGAARLHAGMIAQDILAAFAAQGLDARRYGLFCEDTVMRAVRRSGTDSDGNMVELEDTLEPVMDAGGRPKTVLGLRYDEVAQFVMAGLAARLAALEAR